MAPKVRYTFERLRAIAEESAQKAKESLPNASVLELLRCEYVHNHEEQAFNKDGSLRRETPLTFRWRVKCAGYAETYEVAARCNHVVERGVPFPEHWRTAMQCLSLDELAQASAEKVCDPGLSNVHCVFLGQARLLRPPCSESGVPETGKTVALQSGGERVVYLLVANVRDALWFCHKGSLINGALAENPFHEEDLAIKDIVAEAWDTSTTKRLRSSSQMNTLRALAQSCAHSWCELVSIAQYRSEEIRAKEQGTSIDKRVAARGFQRNPFRWEAGQGRTSHTRVSLLWTWSDGGGCARSAFEHADLHHIVARGIAVPSGMVEADVELYRRLAAIADVETKASKAPCHYLGLDMGAGSYEPDPGKWNLASLDASKTQVNVIYEWKHVKAKGEHHRVSCNVNHLIHNGRRVSGNPLKHSSPTGLTFSIEFFDAVGRNVRTGIQYKGIGSRFFNQSVRVTLPSPSEFCVLFKIVKKTVYSLRERALRYHS